MKILKNERDKNNVKIEVEVESDKVQEYFEKVFKQAAKEMKIPGFRPGKAPRAMIEQNINKSVVRDHAIGDLIHDLYPEILIEAKLEPVSQPELKLLNNKEGEPLTFSLELEVYPEVKLGKYKGISIDKKPIEVTDEDIQKTLVSIQERFARTRLANDSEIAQKDLVELDLEAALEDKPYLPLTRKGLKLIIGEGIIAPEFDSALVGMKVNERKKLKVPFPADHKILDVAGKEVEFSITIKSITKVDLPDLTDEFVKMLGPYAGLEDFKAKMRQELLLAKEQEADNEVKNKTVEELVKGTKADIPNAMVEAEVDVMLSEMQQGLRERKVTLEDYVRSLGKGTIEDFKKELAPAAKTRVLAQVALRAVHEAENLSISEEEMNTEIYRMKESYSDAQVKNFEEALKRGGRAHILEYLLRDKALKFLVEHAKIST